MTSTEGGFPLPAGVEAFDHTADPGLVVRGPTLAALFDRAAEGVRVVIEEAPPSAGTGARSG